MAPSPTGRFHLGSARTALYNYLFIHKGYVEPLLAQTRPGDRFQFERQGYFCTDSDSAGDQPVFNLTVSLKDTWAKIEKSNRSK